MVESLRETTDEALENAKKLCEFMFTERMEYWWNLLNVLTFWELTQVPLCYCLVRHKLPVLWILPVSGDPTRGNITAEVLPAVELALSHLSEQPSPLGNYELQFHLTDSEVIQHTLFYLGPKP